VKRHQRATRPLAEFLAAILVLTLAKHVTRIFAFVGDFATIDFIHDDTCGKKANTELAQINEFSRQDLGLFLVRVPTE